MYCKDCGTKITEGCCPNCHEELYIYKTQYLELPCPVSPEFLQEVVRQYEDAKKILET